MPYEYRESRVPINPRVLAMPAKRRARFHRGSGEDAILAAILIVRDRPIYLYCNALGWQHATEEPPFGETHFRVDPGRVVICRERIIEGAPE